MATTTVSEMFKAAIDAANRCISMITDPAQKAMAYAAIAQALAQTGSITTNINSDNSTANVVNAPTGKESLKNKVSSSKNKPVETSVPPVAESSPVLVKPELTEEWTEEAQTALTNELNFIQTKIAQYGDSSINECVKQFSDGILKSITDINPLNIKGFIAYIEECEAAHQQESA